MLNFGARLLSGDLEREYATGERPLRAELFSISQMEAFGRTLAATHRPVLARGASNQLLARLADNERVLLNACTLLTQAVAENLRIEPAAEWLLDNLHLIEEQIQTARRQFPKGYSRELPRLVGGNSAGLPRVYDLALETISHGDGRMDAGSLQSFVAAYQTAAPLTLGELWAIPIMLRLALIENLRRVGARIAADRLGRDRAGVWADQMIEAAENDPKSLVLVVADMARSRPRMGSSFVAELARRLQGRGPALALPLTWIEQLLIESGQSIEQMVQIENRHQAADRVSISNSIESLRLADTVDWPGFVEASSGVEQTLWTDPAGVYPDMDFHTRDRYRHVVERLARLSSHTELEVAGLAIRRARECAEALGAQAREAHVGYHLVDAGLRGCESLAGARTARLEAFRRLLLGHPLLSYLGALLMMTSLFTGALALAALSHGAGGRLLWVSLALAFLGSSQLAVALGNWIASLVASPGAISRMDYSKGIPAGCRTLVAVPTMLLDASSVAGLVEGLEVRYLANRERHLHFALITDFRDAASETLPEDEALVELARTGIASLNDRYGDGAEDPFFLFHRPRRWNPGERTWMGYERKRGKLADLNAFLRGGAAESFEVIEGRTAPLLGVKYVITLDTDTELPRDSARQFIGSMAHPLNLPVYDDARGRIVSGYGILQPRIAVSVPGANRSRYSSLCANNPGVDPYTRAVSDAYQDLFDEGSFIGKGIYDVDAFERATAGRFPDNRILSHDLLEGCYARSGLMSDALLYEDYPSSYESDVSRRHRWIRGDWQVAAWTLPRVPQPGGAMGKNPLSGLSRWKLIDNIRRSLVPPAMILLLAIAWALLPSPGMWTAAVLGILLVPPVLASLLDALQKPVDVPWNPHLGSSMRTTGHNLTHSLFNILCLPHEAAFSTDAILRTLFRMGVTGRHLLEWTSSAAGDSRARPGLGSSFQTMWMGPALALGMGVCLGIARPSALGAAAPLLLAWMLSPFVAWWLGRPLARPLAQLTAEQTGFLGALARRTWAFFETCAGPEDHWLPPDNLQEQPLASTAHRTSPTNMGLSLLANLSAHDFGYLGAAGLIDRTRQALLTMQGLPRYRGHFYNWYDTLTLEVLPPRYVSTVDSGNLAAGLLTLRAGLLALPEQPIVSPRLAAGLGDTLHVLMEALGEEPSPLAVRLHGNFKAILDARPRGPFETRRWLDRLAASAAELQAGLESGPRKDRVTWAGSLATQCRDAADDLALLLSPAAAEPADPGPVPSLRELAALDSDTGRRALDRIAALEALALQAGAMAEMEYDFLYEEGSHLLAVGYDAGEQRRDPSSYDLLASEARLGSFVAIAQGKIPQENWFRLGRLLTSVGGSPTLLSWSGSMFEYLMPLLVMPSFENTLLDRTCRAAVDRQIAYGRRRGVPWGISESGFNAVDAHLQLQYRAFGVPGLGLKRGLAEDLVIASYASALALMVAPEAACRNLMALSRLGLAGEFGLYEAIDYTPSRLPPGQAGAPVRSFMAHHQGMILLSIAQLLLDRPMQKRFESDPSFRATLLLLQERVPRPVAIELPNSELSDLRTVSSAMETPMRILRTANTAVPEVQLLSNGRYHVMVTNAGGGYSRWKDLAITRWREDATCDSWGTFCYLRDPASGESWSSAYQPTRAQAEKYEAIFSESRVEFRSSRSGLDAHTEIAVSPEDDIEFRRVRLTNRLRKRRTIEVTTYAEVVLAPPASDALHPALSNLFVHTELLPERRAILCSRRSRAADEATPWMFHQVTVHGADSEEVSYETDRARFVGRGYTTANPAAMTGPGALSGTAGSVLDPIVAIRHRVTLEPGASVLVHVVTGAGASRENCEGLIEKYHDRHLADRVFDLAWTHGQVLLRQINATEADAQLYGRLAGSVIFANPSLRADPSVIAENRRRQSDLWGYSISGDLPIVLLLIEDSTNLDLARHLVRAHAYWRLKGLAADLVIRNEEHAGYRQVLHEQILGLVAASSGSAEIERPGGIFVRSGEQASADERRLFQAVARVVLSDALGTLEEQIANGSPGEDAVFSRTGRPPAPEGPVEPIPVDDSLLFFNGLGGFTPDGREYVITTARGRSTPAPWANVLANPRFGCMVTESGGGFTWSENAQTFRLTPWANDPVTDPCGEAFYLRDEDSGHFWSPTLMPARGSGPYTTRHGFGYSVFEHTEGSLHSETWIYVAMDAPVKFTAIKLRNRSDRPRRISVTGYVEWVLGDLRAKTGMHVVTQVDPRTGALFARNSFDLEFGSRIAFFDVADPARSASGDRTEFIGRGGTLRSPAAMARPRLSGKVGAALDPCGALQVSIDLAPGQEREITFLLGCAQSVNEARELVGRFRVAGAAHRALEKVWQHWKHTLGAVQVETPDAAFNMLANGWLLYQTLACRIWGRSGYYQPGGAFGFRDQLQDCMALIHSEPQLLREQILLCAGRQFREGDVQHWWHPPSGRGVRTHCSDDYLWLPAATARYVHATGDTGVLEENISFLEGRPVNPDADAYYDLPGRSAESDTLYEHCKRALALGLRFGAHGLPLMGSGDWNDGMNLVGAKGRGESVWLGFFLHDVLKRFSEVARIREDEEFARECLEEASRLGARIEDSSWDGRWYRRAYMDDGTPLGSKESPECRIDSIAQSWAVLSGAGDPDRARMAMRSLDEELVCPDIGIVKLLDPPFGASDLDPGYIRGYPPGVRENGGQYTHAAIWAVMAFAALGERERAWELARMINPVHHGGSAAAIAVYKVEPYVVAADVYSLPLHAGLGGWTWYTGSAGWMYRLWMESLLGLRLEGERLRVEPCLPRDWKSVKAHYRFRETVYHIHLTLDATVPAGTTVSVDGVQQPGGAILLVDDRKDKQVEIRVGSGD